MSISDVFYQHAETPPHRKGSVVVPILRLFGALKLHKSLTESTFIKLNLKYIELMTVDSIYSKYT